MTDSADTRHVVSVRNGSHNTAAWLHPYKGWYCKHSIRNLRHEGEMRDQIPDADASPAGLPEEEPPLTSPKSLLIPLTGGGGGHAEVAAPNESLSAFTPAVRQCYTFNKAG